MNKELEKRILSTIILIPLTFFFIIKGSFLFNFFLAICFLVTAYEWHMMSKKKNYYIIGNIFLFFSFYCAYCLRNNFEEQSLIIFLITIVTCISTDIGGYIFGKIFKGPKLTKISPKKTYSGMFGGFFLSLIVINFFLNYHYLISGKVIEYNPQILIIILFISFISQTGDIIISFFKRLSKIKNTGKLIPGHGGILDRIDGMLFAFPSSYFLFSLNIVL